MSSVERMTLAHMKNDHKEQGRLAARRSIRLLDYWSSHRGGMPTMVVAVYTLSNFPDLKSVVRGNTRNDPWLMFVPREIIHGVCMTRMSKQTPILNP